MSKAALKAAGALILGTLVLAMTLPAHAQGFFGAVAVVDSKGREVGPYFPITLQEFIAGLTKSQQDSVLLKVAGRSFLLPVAPSGFAPFLSGLGFWYTTNNCTGTAYLSPIPSPNSLTVPLDTGYGVAGGTLYYPKPGASITIKPLSVRGLTSGGLLTPCNTILPRSITAAPAVAFNLSTLGFVPPFRLEW